MILTSNYEKYQKIELNKNIPGRMELISSFLPSILCNLTRLSG